MAPEHAVDKGAISRLQRPETNGGSMPHHDSKQLTTDHHDEARICFASI